MLNLAPGRTLRVNRPLISDTAPTVFPTTATVAPVMGSPWVSVITPVIVFCSCSSVTIAAPWVFPAMAVSIVDGAVREASVASKQ